MSEDVCLVNIGPRGRRQRLHVAVAMGLVVAAGIVFFATHDLPRIWRLGLFLPLLVGALGLFQASAST